MTSGCGGTSHKPSQAASWELPNANLAQTRDVGGPIDRKTVSGLSLAWRVPISGLGHNGGFTMTPVVTGGVVYAQDMESNVYAIDLHSGQVLWKKVYDSPDVGPNGLTLADGMLFGATETSAFALNPSTGKQLWTRRLVRKGTEGIDMAPGYDDGTVYVSTVPGNANGFYGGGGQAILWAMDARTGKTDWKWEEVPSSLWGDPKVNSGGGQWNPPTFDGHGGLYVGVGNPGPFPGTESMPWGASRPGADLYTDSVVKLNARTGKLEWYYQLTPHDIYDWDLNDAPVLTHVGGDEAVIAAGKAGIVLALDARTGRLIWRRPVGKHDGHDEDDLYAERGEFSKLHYGGVILRGGKIVGVKGIVYPGMYGGVASQLASDGSTVFAAVNNYFELFTGPTEADVRAPDDSTGTGEMVAIDQATGRVAWIHRFSSSPYGGATLAGSVVFTTTFDGTVWALDSHSGKTLWHAKLPAGCNAPVTVAGNTLLVGAGFPQTSSEHPAIVAYRLDQK